VNQPTTKGEGGKPSNTFVAKAEPVEVAGSPAASRASKYEPEVGKPLDAFQFPAQTASRHILAAKQSPLFLQLPGLLPLQENRSAWAASADDGSQITRFAASDQMREGNTAGSGAQNMGTDIRRVGAPGVVSGVGKLRLYKSGKAQLVLDGGYVYELTVGAVYRTNQQLVALNLGSDQTEKTCEEIANALTSRLVARPSLASLTSSGVTVAKSLVKS
jgi:hypothetical protein